MQQAIETLGSMMIRCRRCCCSVLALFLLLSVGHGFTFHNNPNKASPSSSMDRTTTTTFTSTQLHSFFNTQQQQQQSQIDGTSNTFLTSPRGSADALFDWAVSVGGAQPHNYQLSTTGGASNWGAVSTAPCAAGDVLLTVPRECRITSQDWREQHADVYDTILAASLGEQNDGQVYLASHACLWLRVLQEYELQEASPFFPWLDALPREFATAVEFDDFELSCLPPFVKYLANVDRGHYSEFLALRPQLTGLLSEETLQDEELLRWAFNVVVTRARASPGDSGEAEIIPLSDMMNHAYNANADPQYDDDGNVHVVATQDINQGNTALCKCYGQPLNPSRFMSTYGFFDVAPPVTYAKFMPDQLEQDEQLAELVGYDDYKNRLVFGVENGDVSPDVWNCMTYLVLAAEGDSDAQQAFYQACTAGNDEATIQQIQDLYGAATVQALAEHVNEVLTEIDECQETMDEGGGMGLQHKHLPVIRRHNEFVRQVFKKVQWNLQQMM